MEEGKYSLLLIMNLEKDRLISLSGQNVFANEPGTGKEQEQREKSCLKEDTRYLNLKSS